MTDVRFRRIEHPEPGGHGSAYDVLVGDAVIGQVWQIRYPVQVFGGWKKGGHKRMRTSWVSSASRDDGVDTRQDAASFLPGHPRKVQR